MLLLLLLLLFMWLFQQLNNYIISLTCGVGHIFIVVLSRDGLDPRILWQRGLCVVYAHPGTIPGWSEYLWVLGYSDRRGCVCVCHAILLLSSDGQSISGSQDTLTRGDCVWCMLILRKVTGSQDTLTEGGGVPIRYHPGMVRVSLDPGILWPKGGCVPIPLLSWDGQSIPGPG